MENKIGRRLALLAGWGAVLFYILAPGGVAINAAHAPTVFLVALILGPMCTWTAMWIEDHPLKGNLKFDPASALELISALTLAFYLLAFAVSWMGAPHGA